MCRYYLNNLLFFGYEIHDIFHSNKQTNLEYKYFVWFCEILKSTQFWLRFLCVFFFYIFETQKNRDLFEFNAMFFKTLNLPLKHTAMKRITIISFDLNNFQMLFFIQHHWVCGSNIDFISFFKRRKTWQRKLCLVFISLHKVFDWGKNDEI